MYRRGFLVFALIFLLIALWLGARHLTVTTGTIFSQSGPRHHTCGSTIGILIYEEYAPGIEGSFLRPRCWEEAVTRAIDQGLLVALAFGFTVAGLVRGPAPPLRSINVLAPLPTPEEMRRSRLRVVTDVDDIR